MSDLAHEYRLLHKASNDLWASHILLVNYAPSLRRLIKARSLPSISLPALVHPRSTKVLAGKDAIAVVNRLAGGLDAQRTLLDMVGRFEAFLHQVSAWTYADAAHTELVRCTQARSNTVSSDEARNFMESEGYRFALEEDARAEVRDSVRSFDQWFASDLAVLGVADHFGDEGHTRSLTRLREINARRNAIAHNRARIDAEYQRQSGMTSLTLGGALVTDAEYLAVALLTLRLVAACVANCAITNYGGVATGDIERAARTAHGR